MALFKICRGNEARLPSELKDGYAYFCTDSGRFYIDYTDAEGELKRKQVNASMFEAIAEDIVRLDEKIIQSDYAQNDPTAQDYIKNRLAWTEDIREVVLEEQGIEIILDGEEYRADIEGEFDITQEELILVWDGIEYVSTIIDAGNAYICMFTNGITFIFLPEEKSGGFLGDDSHLGTHTVAIYQDKKEIHQIDPKYLPDGVATETYVDTAIDTEINTLIDNGQIGVDIAKKYIFDGNTEGLPTVSYEETLSYVKISDDTPDLHNFVSVTSTAEVYDGDRYEYKVINGSANEDDDAFAAIVLDITEGDDTLQGAKGSVITGENPVVIVITDISDSSFPSTGLYVMYGTGTGIAANIRNWVSEIDLGNEIKTINSKYIPEGVATEVYVDETIDTLATSGQIGSDEVKTIVATTDAPEVGIPAEVKSLVGMEATCVLPDGGWYFLKAPHMNLDTDYYANFDATSGSVFYFNNSTNGDKMTKRAFIIGGDLSDVCPTFALNYPDYTDILYFYEETSDTLGMGITVQPGWYAFNSNTFAHTEFNITDNPFIIKSFDDLTIRSDSGNLAFIKTNWFELKQSYSFTVAEKNCHYRDTFVLLLGADASALPEDGEIDDKLLYLLHAGSADLSEDNHVFVLVMTGYKSTTLSYKVTKPIDPKYLPEGGFGYTDTKSSYVFPETTITIADGQYITNGLLGLVVGKEYIVSWNGTEYTCVAKLGSMQGGSFIFLGNAYIASQNESENTGEPFVLGDMAANNISGFITASGDGEYVVSIKYDVDVIHTIDPKYLPEGGFGYTELDVVGETIFPETTITVSDSEYSAEGLFGLNEGQTYIVNWNGTEHYCTAIAIEGTPAIALGNLSIYREAKFDNTGEEFFLVDVLTENVRALATSSGDGDYTLSITEFFPEFVHKIDPKYLPEGGFGYEADQVYTYDGDQTGKEVVSNDYGSYYSWIKISNETPESSELKSVAMTNLTSGEVTKSYLDDGFLGITRLSDSDGNDCGYVVREVNTGWNLAYVHVITSAYEEFSSPGIYVFHIHTDEADGWVSELDFGTTVHTIDPKFLPAGGFGYTERERITILPPTEITTGTYDDATSATISGAFNISDGDNLVVAWNGVEYKTTVELSKEGADIYDTDVLIFGDEDAFGIAYFPERSALIFYADEGTYTVAIYKDNETIHAIDPKYYERLAWSENEFVEFIPETTITIGEKGALYVEGLLGLEVDEKYIVNWNGTEYHCTGVSATVGDDSGIFLGNYYLFTQNDADNTGEEFLLGDILTNNMHAFMASGGAGDYTLNIKRDNEIVHKIDPKYYERLAGEETIVSKNTLSWDGTPTNVCVEHKGVQYYKVSDSTPTTDELIGGSVALYINGGAATQFTITSEHTTQVTDEIFGVYIDTAPLLVVAKTDGATFQEEGLVFPEKGIYFYVQSVSGYTMYPSLTVVGYNFVSTKIKTLDPKFLPDGLATETYVDEAVAAATELPASTEADNGKFLRLIDGVVTWASVPSAEEVAF